MKTSSYTCAGCRHLLSEAYLEGMKTFLQESALLFYTALSEAYLEGMKTHIICRAGTALFFCPKPTSKE